MAEVKERRWLRRILGSVRFRLTLWFVAILAIILGGFSLFIYFRQGQVLRSEATTRLLAEESQLAGYYRVTFHSIAEQASGEGDSDEPFLESMPLLQNTDLLALVGGDSQIVQRSLNFPQEDLLRIYDLWKNSQDPNSLIETSFSPSDAQDSPQSYLFAGNVLDLERESQTVLLVGSPIDPGGQLPRLALTLAGVFLLTLIIAFAGGFWLANRAMHPVQVITHTAQKIGEHDLSRRLHLDGENELSELGATFDQMLDRLQAAFNRQRQFTADASHELRTPLSVIELETERTLETPRTPKEYQAALQVIQSENEWMSRLVDQLLTLARMDSGKAVLENEKLDMSDVAVDVVERLTPLADRNHVSLRTGALDEGIVWSDRNLLMHVLTNLVANALKYARSESPQVLVETGTQLREGAQWAWATVKDNGPGIPPEHLPHLFDRFYRVDAARTQSGVEEADSTSGSGLGLAIVHSIIELLGGHVEVTSELGKGANFTIWLPEAK